MVLFECGQDTL